MRLTCIMPLLKVVHVIIKFAQDFDIFACDFETIVNMCCVKLCNMYLAIEKKYSIRKFKAFLYLHKNNND
jgi:hypothetical protein